MTLKTHALFWSFVSLAFFVTLYLLKGILLPFVLAFIIAYFLEPVMTCLSRKGVNRSVAAFGILFVFFAAVGALLLALLPIAYRELVTLSADIPKYSDTVFNLLDPTLQKFRNIIGQSTEVNIRELFMQHAGTAADVSKKFAGLLWAGGQAFANLIAAIVITPIVAYFVMKEWASITDWIEDLMPRDSKNTIMDLLEQINSKVSGFVRGQITVAAVLGIAYAIALSIAGLKYGVLIGLIAGLLSIIPMLGSTLGLLSGVLLAWLQTSDWTFMLIIAAIFLVGQIIEGNILTPRLIGGSVGMHPLWVFFALMAGGALFGIVGMLLAVPIAAIIGVLLAFGLTQYKASPYYKGKTKAKKKKAKKSA